LIAVLVIGIVRRWRWAFWLIMVAFLFGVLRLPASALQLAGLMPATGPNWYEALQGIIGLVQFLIALAMFSGYRKAGVWGAVAGATAMAIIGFSMATCSTLTALRSSTS